MTETAALNFLDRTSMSAELTEMSLYPRESSTREVRKLDGIWEFKIDDQNVGIEEQWHKRALQGTRPMAVPSSFNDLGNSSELREHIGCVWYERFVHIPLSWKGRRVSMRVGAAWHRCCVWLNGIKLTSHTGGFLPFEVIFEKEVIWNSSNRITIVVDNRLDYLSIPHGRVEPRDKDDAASPQSLHIHGDVFPYAGLHRSIFLCASGAVHLASLATWTEKRGPDAWLHVNSGVDGGPFTQVELELIDETNFPVAKGVGTSTTLRIPSARFWFPGKPFLHTLNIHVFQGEDLADAYSLPIGLRTVAVRGEKFLINDTPFQFRGFGKTEDNEIRGRGWDAVNDLKDFELMAWVGANSFRTAHQPFAEETLQLADRLGIAIIEEASALSIWIPETGRSSEGISPKTINGHEFAQLAGAEDHSLVYERTLEDHLKQMTGMIARDMNSPSVVMWSLGNEINTTTAASRTYFEEIASHTRNLDPSRPITKAECFPADESLITDLVDVISVNRYYGWYTQCGHLNEAGTLLGNDLIRWHKLTGKPIFLTEFGAEAIAGLHQDPPVMFSEEYQEALIKTYLEVCDRLPFVIGTHVWTFTDFMTKQGTTRIDGNKKGVFTRDRRPKLAAHFLRRLWTA